MGYEKGSPKNKLGAYRKVNWDGIYYGKVKRQDAVPGKQEHSLTAC